VPEAPSIESLLFRVEHFAAAVGGAEGFAVGLVRRLTARGVRVTVVCRTCTGEFPGVTVVPQRPGADNNALHADVTVDWGLACEADLHRLGGGVHRAFLGRNLMSEKTAVHRLVKRLVAFGPRQQRTIRREDRLLRDPRTHVLCVSGFVRDQALFHYPRISDRAHVLRNGVDTQRFVPLPAEERVAVRRRLGVPEEAFAALFSAHNLKLKNFDLVYRLFSELNRSGTRAFLCVMGKREPRPRAPWLLYLGRRSDPERACAAVDCLVHPTYYDACSNVVLEAMACGVPALSSNQNGSAELIEHGRSGFVLPVTGRNHEQAWSVVLRRLLETPAWARRLGVRARAVAEQHDLDAYAEGFLELCREVRQAVPRRGGES
jgi:UDP-glucose:(heptosyl)LPS alpha-1,3-glucosyltransferase